MDERIWEGLLSTALAILDDLEARGARLIPSLIATAIAVIKRETGAPR